MKEQTVEDLLKDERIKCSVAKAVEFGMDKLVERVIKRESDQKYVLDLLRKEASGDMTAIRFWCTLARRQDYPFNELERKMLFDSERSVLNFVTKLYTAFEETYKSHKELPLLKSAYDDYTGQLMKYIKGKCKQK